MAGSSTDGAFEPIVVRNAAAERTGRENCMVITIISFNFGIEQQMLDSGQWITQHKAKFLELLHSFVAGYHADMVLGCAVGGHKRGLTQDQMDGLKQDVLATKFCQNYMLALKRDGEVIERLPPFPATTSSGFPCDP